MFPTNGDLGPSPYELVGRGPFQRLLDSKSSALKDESSVFSLEAQQRYFSYCAILVAIVSQTSLVLVLYGVSHNYRAIRSKMGYRTDVPV